jgi:starch phosphorylase
MLIPAADLSEQISTAGYEASGTGNMKLAMNGALTIGTEDGANIEMHESVTSKWWPFAFGASAEEIDQMKKSGSYNPNEIYESNPKIRDAVDALASFAESAEEEKAFKNIRHVLLEGHHGAPADQYFVLQDLQSYYDTQIKVETLYQEPHSWAKYALHNIAGMGPFSTDNSILNYNELVWGLQPILPDPEIKARVEEEYRKHDKCRIY